MDEGRRVVARVLAADGILHHRFPQIAFLVAQARALLDGLAQAAQAVILVEADVFAQLHEEHRQARVLAQTQPVSLGDLGVFQYLVEHGEGRGRFFLGLHVLDELQDVILQLEVGFLDKILDLVPDLRQIDGFHIIPPGE